MSTRPINIDAHREARENFNAFLVNPFVQKSIFGKAGTVTRCGFGKLLFRFYGALNCPSRWVITQLPLRKQRPVELVIGDKSSKVWLGENFDSFPPPQKLAYLDAPARWHVPRRFSTTIDPQSRKPPITTINPIDLLYMDTYVQTIEARFSRADVPSIQSNFVRTYIYYYPFVIESLDIYIGIPLQRPDPSETLFYLIWITCICRVKIKFLNTTLQISFGADLVRGKWTDPEQCGARSKFS